MNVLQLFDLHLNHRQKITKLGKIRAIRTAILLQVMHHTAKSYPNLLQLLLKMAYKSQVILFALLVLAAIAGQGLAWRQISETSKNVDVKQPEFLKFDHSFLIPGIGRVLVPPVHGVPSYDPVPGRHTYVPGGDDTFVPNPGFEVPNPGHAGSVPAQSYP